MNNYFVKHNNEYLRIIYIFGFILIPLIFWPWSPVPFEIPKVWFFQKWVDMVLIISIIYLLFHKPIYIKNKPILLLMIIFLLISFISSIFGADFQKSLWGNYYRHDGLFTLVHLISFAVICALFWKESWSKSIAASIVLGSFITSLWSVISGIRLYLFHDLSVPNWNGAIGVSFGQPNFAAGYFLVTLPFLYFLYVSSETKYIRISIILICIIQITAICLTFSSGALLGTLLFFFLIYLVNRKRVNGLHWFGTLTVLIFSTLLLFNLINRNSGFLPEGRPRIMIKTLLGAMKRPLLGWGVANVDYAFKEVPYPIYFQNDIYLDKAHSHLLEMFTASGIIGLSVYILIIVYILRRLSIFAYQKKSVSICWHRTLLLVFLLFLFHSQTNVISIAEELFFWLIAGITASYS